MKKDFTFSLAGVRYSANLNSIQLHKLFTQEQVDGYAISQLAIDKGFQKALIQAGRTRVIGDATSKGKSKSIIDFDILDEE